MLMARSARLVLSLPELFFKNGEKACPLLISPSQLLSRIR